MKLFLPLILSLLFIPAVLEAKNPPKNCKTYFSFAYIDRLENHYYSIQGKELKDVEKKLSKYGDVCYTATESSADLVFFVHTKPAVYHGTQALSSTSTHTDTNPVEGTITDEDGNRSRISGTVDTTTTTTTTSYVPYDMNYSVFILDVLVPKDGPNGRTYSTLRTFDQAGLYNTIYGIGYGKGKHPVIALIDVAAKWTHEQMQRDVQKAGRQ